MNELLDRELLVPLNVRICFLSFTTQDLFLFFREACLTPELTRREGLGEAFNPCG
ncbi:MAG TPA: hypothetical protein VGC66_24245 [Pyrinomonadaceae bacterium]